MSTDIDEHHGTARCLELRGLAAAPGTVQVLIAHRWCQRPVCTCGWTGRVRMLRSRSVVQALIHAARSGCHPAVPLIKIGTPPAGCVTVDAAARAGRTNWFHRRNCRTTLSGTEDVDRGGQT